jgi:hypothetical protein
MDAKIRETGSGGDLILSASGRDFVTVEGFENMPYLAMFGGNVDQSTPSERTTEEQRFDWWGNALFMGNQPGLQFNSETERALNETALTSSGRQVIFNAVKADLLFMKDFANVSIAVALPAIDRVVIGVRLERPGNLSGKQFIFIWDKTEQELLEVAETATDYVLTYSQI